MACQAVGLWLFVVFENPSFKQGFFGNYIVLKFHKGIQKSFRSWWTACYINTDWNDFVYAL